MWQLGFMSAPTALPQLEHGLKVDDRILRYIVIKKRALGPMPNTYRVARTAEKVLEGKDNIRLPS